MAGGLSVPGRTVPAFACRDSKRPAVCFFQTAGPWQSLNVLEKAALILAGVPHLPGERVQAARWAFRRPCFSRNAGSAARPCSVTGRIHLPEYMCTCIRINRMGSSM